MRKRKMRGWIIGIVLLALLVPAVCFAQVKGSNDPRDSFPAPSGLQAFLLYYQNISASKQYTQGQLTNNNADLNAQLAVARWVGYYEVIPRWTVALSFLQPYGYKSLGNNAGTANGGNSSSGLGDLYGVVANYFNWAKSPNFTAYTDLSFYVYTPWGEYDRNKALNLGNNIWSYRLTFIPWAIRVKSLTWELAGSIDWYETNNEANSSYAHLGRDPLYSAWTHVTYDITKQFWVGLSYFYYNGGATEVNGVKQYVRGSRNTINEQMWQGTAAVAITPAFQAMFQYQWDSKIDNGFDQHIIKFRFAYAWQ